MGRRARGPRNRCARARVCVCAYLRACARAQAPAGLRQRALTTRPPAHTHTNTHIYTRAQARLSPAARAETKRFVRAPLADAWWAQVDAEAAACWAGLNEEGTVRALGAVLARLSGGKKEGVAAKL